MKIKLLLLTLFTISISCSQNKAPKGKLSDEQILFEYAIYFLEDNIVEVTDAKKIIEEAFPTFKILDSIPSPELVEGSGIIISTIKNVKEQFPPMSIEYLQYSNQGLSDKEKLDLQESKHVLLLDFICTKNELIKTIEKANEYVKRLLKNSNAVIYDSETRETFSKDFWNKKRLIKNNSLNISNHITIHFYHKNEYCRAITLGMLKFGLPDICIENLSCQSSLEISSFINLTAQTFLEEQEINKNGKLELNIDKIKNNELKTDLISLLFENAEKKAEINLIKGVWEEGDPENRLYEIGFSEKNPQIEHNELITKLFGSEDDITMLKHDDELLEASNRSKEKIPELYKLFSDGLDLNSHLLIKFPFKNSDGENEWMWVEITKWEGDNIKGLLQNEPRIVKNLKAGQEVSKNINDMFDYILYKSDGSQEGNETGEIIMKMQK